MIPLADYVRQVRRERGLSQLALGEMIGVDQAQISRIEAGRGSLSPSALAWLATLTDDAGAELLAILRAGV